MPYCDPAHQLVVEVYVRDLRRSLEFYGRLGFELLRDDGGFAERSGGGHHFFLEEVEALPVEPPPPIANMRLVVPDVDRYAALAADMGATIVKPVADRYYGLRDFTMLDPDGFGLRFATRLVAAT